MRPLRAALAVLLAALAALAPVRAEAPGEAAGAFAMPGDLGESLPVLYIDLDGGAAPGDAPVSGTLRYVEPGSPNAVQTPVTLRLRGNTSRRFPKKCFRLELADGAGQKRDLPLCGLRADDDWVLNALYSDTSKLREALCYWLWDEINSCGRVAASSRMAYAEVVLNGEYHGLYGVQERVDRKQVGADKRTGLLYKVATNERPTVQALLNAEDDACGGIELAFTGTEVASPWAPAADYMALLLGEEVPGDSRVNPDNAVDYALWSMLVQARDGRFKNQYIHCVPRPGGGYALYRIPWDLNHTLGDLWAGDSPRTNYVAYAIGEAAPDDLAVRLLAEDAAFMDALRARWRALRSGPVTERNIMSHADALFEALYPAILRDTTRWPACGMGEGSAANIRDIGDYVRAALARLDGYFGLER